MQIRELASRTGMTASAIRFYEASGLLAPAERAANGYRVYGDSAVQRLLVIQLAQRLGFTLESLRLVLNTPSGMPHDLIAQRIQTRLEEINTMQKLLRSQRKELLALSEQLEAEWTSGNCLTLTPLEPASASAQLELRATGRQSAI